MNVYVFVLALVTIIMWFLYRIARIGVDRQDARYGQDDTELIQEIHRGLARMEQRVETLETLLLDKQDEPAPRYEDVINQEEHRY